LNAILFDFNNMESESSLSHTISLYSIDLLLSGLILILLVLGLFLSSHTFPSLQSTSVIKLGDLL
jgi:hypothetical protein